MIEQPRDAWKLLMFKKRLKLKTDSPEHSLFCAWRAGAVQLFEGIMVLGQLSFQAGRVSKSSWVLGEKLSLVQWLRPAQNAVEWTSHRCAWWGGEHGTLGCNP